MDKGTENLLTRWRALESGDGVKRASAFTRVLWIVGLGLCAFVVLGVAYDLPRAAVAAAAAAMGWAIAECNALRTRLSQWPDMKRYIDWKRVDEDLAARGERL